MPTPGSQPEAEARGCQPATAPPGSQPEAKARGCQPAVEPGGSQPEAEAYGSQPSGGQPLLPGTEPLLA